MFAAPPTIHTDHGCYVVGQIVHVAGRGFGPSRQFDLAVDGADFGQAITSRHPPRIRRQAVGPGAAHRVAVD